MSEPLAAGMEVTTHQWILVCESCDVPVNAGMWVMWRTSECWDMCHMSYQWMLGYVSHDVPVNAGMWVMWRTSEIPNAGIWVTWRTSECWDVSHVTYQWMLGCGSHKEQVMPGYKPLTWFWALCISQGNISRRNTTKWMLVCESYCLLGCKLVCAPTNVGMCDVQHVLHQRKMYKLLWWTSSIALKFCAALHQRGSCVWFKNIFLTILLTVVYIRTSWITRLRPG